ncbi:hypothetical protein [Phaeovulum sp. W22_SRMD_FR3]|uniref:hypothetical protein n=1 Tax=Phaeovulum sp. W22_SRMD_FR3 TaxID=3240274 RepID=UPI003F9BFB87
MQMIAESYRGISVVLDLALDRLLLPVALIVALLGAGIIVHELLPIWGNGPVNAHQL